MTGQCGQPLAQVASGPGGVVGFNTVGVDLAAQDARTGLAVIDWHPDGATVRMATVGAGNDEIVALARSARLVGIDCPLGWPVAFTDLLVAARAHTVRRGAGRTSADRRSLAFRHTDFHVHQVTGRWPLSVSADLIGYPAMRAAGLLAELAGDGHVVNRSGVGSIAAEVYPAAALRIWKLPVRGYKTDADSRSALLDALSAAAGWLDLIAAQELCRTSHDALDAVVAAVVAGAVALGRTTPAPAELTTVAAEEGWIHVPDAGFLCDPSAAAGVATAAASAAWRHESDRAPERAGA